MRRSRFSHAREERMMADVRLPCIYEDRESEFTFTAIWGPRAESRDLRSPRFGVQGPVALI